MSSLRIAIAGLGRIGWSFHARMLQKEADFEIVAVADPEADRLAEAAETLGCDTYQDVSEMLQQAELDAVVIATPTHLHEAMAKEAFERGLHVLLEKPMAPTAKEARNILEAATHHDRLLTIYQPHRLAAYFQHLKSVIDSGRIGRVVRAQVALFSFARRNDWQALLKYSGGMLHNYGAHGLDQVLQLVGYDVARCFCNLQMIATLGDADDAVKIVLETKQGALGELDISQASAVGPYSINVWGTCGGIVMHGRDSMQVRWFDPAKLPPKKLEPQLASTDRQYPKDHIDWHEERIEVDAALQLELYQNFAAAIRGEAEIAVPPAETVALMEMLDRLRDDSQRIHDFRS